MANILSFDSNNLNSLLENNGLILTWLRILVTKVGENPRHTYIAEDPTFDGIVPLDTNLLDGLSIGEISVLYEYSVAKTNAKNRKNNGQYFTPDDVAIFMASRSSSFGRGVWLDPCAGVGNLTWHLVAKQDDPEAFLLNNMLVADTDGLALLIARVLLTVGFQRNTPELFHRIRDRFMKFDFLSVAEDGKENLLVDDMALDAIPAHDFVIMNPPYLAGSKDARFETSQSGDLYAYFMENAAKTSIGFISVTPQSFTNAAKFRPLRALLLRRFSSLTVYAFDNVPANIFRGIKFGSTNSNKANSTRAAITVASNSSPSNKITGLTRWRSVERERLFKEIDNHLSEVEFSHEFFPKVQARQSTLYFAVKDLPRLRETVARVKTNFSIYVPSSPRYFIPALKTPAQRASQREIHFESPEQMDRAYLLINSSLMYWWWRVRDGGMTLSLQTLLSLPVPNFALDHNLIRELEDSELVNKVYKKNGGAPQENVKHPIELIERVNELVLPKHRETLMRSHRNSEFS